MSNVVRLIALKMKEMKYRLLNRQIFQICRLRGDDCPPTLHRRPLQPFTVKAVQLRLPQGPNLLLRPQ